MRTNAATGREAAARHSRLLIPEIYPDSPTTSFSFAYVFQASQLFWNCALASSSVATLSERAIGGSTVGDQNQRRRPDHRASHRSIRPTAHPPL